MSNILQKKPKEDDLDQSTDTGAGAEEHVSEGTDYRCHTPRLSGDNDNDSDHELNELQSNSFTPSTPLAPSHTACVAKRSVDNTHSPSTSISRLDNVQISDVNIDPFLVVPAKVDASSDKENTPSTFTDSKKSIAAMDRSAAKPVPQTASSPLSSLSGSPRNVEVKPTSAPVDWSLPQGEPDLTSPSASNRYNAAAKPWKRLPLGGIDVNRRRSGRNQETGENVANEFKGIPSGGRWIIDAVNYLKDSFRGFPMSDELITEFMGFEKSMGYRTSKVRLSPTFRLIMTHHIPSQAAKDRLATSQLPDAIVVWLRGDRDFYKIPTAVHPPDVFIKNLILWYHSLQPSSRRIKWDYLTDFNPPYGTLPAHPEEWNDIRKGGPYGLFLIILALSWLPVNMRYAEERIKIEALIKDFTWVLKLISNPVYMNQNVPVSAVAKGVERKRKLSQVASSLSKNKKRKGL